MKRRRTPLACSSSTWLSSASTNRPISSDTSSGGRAQFSLENAKTVSAPIPRAVHVCTQARRALMPALWPACRGRLIDSWNDRAWSIHTGLDLHDLLLFGRKHLIDVRDMFVGQLLDLPF